MPSPITEADWIPQACAVPYRHRGSRLEFCLITSTSGRRWGFPKGIIEAGQTAEATALQEALEEAGVHGQLVGEPLGAYRYRKWGTQLHVVAYLMEVQQADHVWEECDVRHRAWLATIEALERLDREELRKLLQTAAARLSESSPQ